MRDDDQILDLLAQALVPEPGEPEPERVAAVRALAAAPTATAPSASASGPRRPAAAFGPRRPVAAFGPRRPAAGPTERPSPRPPHGVWQSPGWQKRVGWSAAAVSVAAAIGVVALLAAPSLSPLGGSSGSAASVAGTRSAMTRLRVALASRDAVAVAMADADLLRHANQLPDRRQQEVVADAVQAHVDAIEFIRDNPSPAAFSAVPKPAPGSGTGDGEVAAPSTPDRGPGTRATPAAPGATVPSPTTTLAPGSAPAPPRPRSVRVQDVTARLDGTFHVDFATSGFTPDGTRAPGTFAVRFTFDSGASPTVWAGPSPWTFPVVEAVRYRRVCARVVGADGIEEPDSGGCHDILD